MVPQGKIWEVPKTKTWICCTPTTAVPQQLFNPLQCSCLENPRDRGALWAAVYGIAQSQRQLNRLSSSSSSSSSNNCLNYIEKRTREITAPRDYIITYWPSYLKSLYTGFSRDCSNYDKRNVRLFYFYLIFIAYHCWTIRAFWKLYCCIILKNYDKFQKKVFYSSTARAYA